MQISFLKTCLAFLLCLAFLSQAVASKAMLCHMGNMQEMSSHSMSNSTSKYSHDMSQMSSSAHHMMNMTSQDEMSSKMDCCNEVCRCFTGGCSSIAAIHKDVEPNSQLVLSTKINFTSILKPSQQLVSLYRPPILC